MTDEPAKKQIGYSSPSANERDLTYTATNLQINKATIDWKATAKITVTGNDYKPPCAY